MVISSIFASPPMLSKGAKLIEVCFRLAGTLGGDISVHISGGDIGDFIKVLSGIWGLGGEFGFVASGDGNKHFRIDWALGITLSQSG